MDGQNVLTKEIADFCMKVLERPLAADTTKNYQSCLKHWQTFHNSYLKVTADILECLAKQFNLATEPAQSLTKIEAASVVIEVMDQNTGKVYRRQLPINYLENSNGLILSGETIEGTPSQIAFLSDTALTKITDLCGQGADAPRCKD